MSKRVYDEPEMEIISIVGEDIICMSNNGLNKRKEDNEVTDFLTPQD